jgi:hypothetical protein
MSKTPERAGGGPPKADYFVETSLTDSPHGDKKIASLYLGLSDNAPNEEVLFRNFDNLSMLSGNVWDRINFGTEVLNVEEPRMNAMFRKAYGMLKQDGLISYRTGLMEEAELEHILAIAVNNSFNKVSIDEEVLEDQEIVNIVWQKVPRRAKY